MPLSEEQPRIIDYCNDCACTLYEIDGRYRWATDFCPYNDGGHRVEHELELEAEE